MKKLLILLFAFCEHELKASFGESVGKALLIGTSLVAVQVGIAGLNAAAIAREEYVDPQGAYHYRPEEILVPVRTLFYSDRQVIENFFSAMQNHTTFVAGLGMAVSAVPLVGIPAGLICAARAHGLANQTVGYAINPLSPTALARRVELNTHRAAHELEKLVDPRYKSR